MESGPEGEVLRVTSCLLGLWQLQNFPQWVPQSRKVKYMTLIRMSKSKECMDTRRKVEILWISDSLKYSCNIIKCQGPNHAHNISIILTPRFSVEQRSPETNEWLGRRNGNNYQISIQGICVLKGFWSEPYHHLKKSDVSQIRK